MFNVDLFTMSVVLEVSNSLTLADIDEKSFIPRLWERIIKESLLQSKSKGINVLHLRFRISEEQV